MVKHTIEKVILCILRDRLFKGIQTFKCYQQHKIANYMKKICGVACNDIKKILFFLYEKKIYLTMNQSSAATERGDEGFLYLQKHSSVCV